MSAFPRSSGILCHVTSLPGRWGIGDLGEAASRFADWLTEAGQGLWQVLPLGPPGFGESPYQSFSAFAGNPLLVGMDRLAEKGWLSTDDLEAAPNFDRHAVDFEKVRPFREHCLTQAYHAFRKNATSEQRDAFDDFRHEQSWWLDDYALFAALKREHRGLPWTQWHPDLVARKTGALQARAAKLMTDIDEEAFAQFQYHSQWQRLKADCNSRGIRLMGDVPIFVAHDSADVWARQELFFLDGRGQPTLVAGVPPDYFSAAGQLWGNPLYRWDRMQRDGYAWWVGRLRYALAQFDLIRLDHFRGFEAYWEIPAGAPTAAPGRWVSGPGAPFFRKVREELGDLPLVAEDLGVITPAVEALRDEFGFPGMRILQFAFGDDPKARDYRPHNYPRHCVVYTGTHDNDTTVGWFQSRAGQGTTRTARQIDEERLFALAYLGTAGSEIHWDLIRLALASVAETAVVPVQDVLGLGTEARMNLPGTLQGNWRWRFAEEMLTPAIAGRLRELTAIYDRLS
ncbi:MAG: 4-alpha-glucanotransferase [Deltaproteobacteria bacterium]